MIFGDATPTGIVTSGSITTIAASTLSSGAGLSTVAASGYPVAPGSGVSGSFSGSGSTGNSSSSIGSLGGSIGSAGNSGIANNGGQVGSSTPSTDLGINQAGQIGSDQMSAGILQALILANNNFEVAKMIFDPNAGVSVSMVEGEDNFDIKSPALKGDQLRNNPDKKDASRSLDKIKEKKIGKKNDDEMEGDD